MSIDLFDLLWEDILIPNVVPYLSVYDLYNLSLVSKRGEEFANFAIKKVEKLVISSEETIQRDPNFSRFIAKCRSLKELHYYGALQFKLINLLKNNKNLTTLKIDMKLFLRNKMGQKRIREFCKVIKSKQILESFDFEPRNILSQSQLHEIYKRLPNLKYIKTGKRFSDDIVYTITKTCRQLVRLDLNSIGPDAHKKSIQ